MLREFWEFISEVGPTLLLIIIIIFAIAMPFVAFGMYMDGVACKTRWESSGYPSKWSALTGCQINYEGRWIPEGSYRIVD